MKAVQFSAHGHPPKPPSRTGWASAWMINWQLRAGCRWSEQRVKLRRSFADFWR